MAGSCWGSCWRATAILCIIRLRFAIVVGFANALRAGLSATHVQLAREWVCCKCAVGSGTRRRKARSAQMEAPTTQPPADNDCEANAAPSGPQALHTRGGSLLLCSDCVTQKNLVTTMCAFVLFFVLKYQLRNCAPVMLQKGTAAYSLHNWQECQATHGRKHCGSYCSLAANYSGGQTNVAHSPRSSWSFNLRKSGLPMHPATFNRKASARPLMMSTATGERGPNQPNNYGKNWNCIRSPGGNKQTYVNTYVVRISQSTFGDFKIYRCANFAIHFWISECPWALLGRQKTPTCANNSTNTSIARRHAFKCFDCRPPGFRKMNEATNI